MPQVDKNALDWVPISPETLKMIYDDELNKANVEVSFFSTLVGAETSNNNITDIYIAKKDGITSYKSKIFIDCTGDANLAFFSGVPCEKGGESGELQPCSLCFIICNINMNAMKGVELYGYSDRSPIHEIIKSDKYPLIKESHLCIDILADGIFSFNAGHIWDSDGTRPECVLDAITRGRALAAEYHRALKDILPEAFGNSFLIATAPLLGTRETRRIKGLYTFTVQDYIERKSFPDEISRNCYYIDLHDERSTGDMSEEEIKKLAHYSKGESHGIPYRCLIPQNINNLLVAGRAISSDRTSNASLRVMPNCLTTGEAAGTAAYLACQDNCSPEQVNINNLRELLTKNGAYIKGERI